MDKRMSFWQAGISSKVTRDPIRPNEREDDEKEIRGRGKEEEGMTKTYEALNKDAAKLIRKNVDRSSQW